MFNFFFNLTGRIHRPGPCSIQKDNLNADDIPNPQLTSPHKDVCLGLSDNNLLAKKTATNCFCKTDLNPYLSFKINTSRFWFTFLSAVGRFSFAISFSFPFFALEEVMSKELKDVKQG